ncbi:MAG: VCBS repeat-containing protein [Gammaproteobacteria bacterium]
MINQGNGSFRGAPHYLNPLFNRPSSPVLAPAQRRQSARSAVSLRRDYSCKIPTGASPRRSASGAPAEQLATGDFNKDNKADLALVKRGVSVSDPGTLTILPGNGAGGFGAQTQQLPLAASVTFAVRATDLNKNGALDLVVAQTDKNNWRSSSATATAFQTKPVVAVR